MITDDYFIILPGFSSNILSFFLQYRRYSRILPTLWTGALLLAVGLGVGEAWARPAEDSSPEILLSLARVDSLLAVGALQQALVEAKALQASHGGDLYHGWQIESRVGVALLRSGDPGLAVPSLENAIRLAPDQPENHRNLGAALLILGRKGRALSEYEQAVELAPRDFTLRLEYGQLLLDFQDLGRAREQLQIAKSLCLGCPETLQPLARMYLASGDFVSAIPTLQSLYSRQPTKGVRRSLVQALQGAGRDSLLLEFLGEGSLVDLPADEAMLLVEVEGKLNRTVHSQAFVQAMVDEAQESRLVPATVRSRGDFWGRISYNLMLAEKNRPALTALNRAIILDPDNAVYRNNRVVLLTRLGLHDEAAEEWRKVLALDPTLEGSNKR